jgi:hypothetical protein
MYRFTTRSQGRRPFPPFTTESPGVEAVPHIHAACTVQPANPACRYRRSRHWPTVSGSSHADPPQIPPTRQYRADTDPSGLPLEPTGQCHYRGQCSYTVIIHMRKCSFRDRAKPEHITRMPDIRSPAGTARASVRRPRTSRRKLDSRNSAATRTTVPSQTVNPFRSGVSSSHPPHNF